MYVHWKPVLFPYTTIPTNRELGKRLKLRPCFLGNSYYQQLSQSLDSSQEKPLMVRM